jgi:hypothetical protein
MRRLGQMGERRLGIALIWFLPTGESEPSAPTEEISAEDRDIVEGMMGMEAEVAVGHLLEMARRYQQDPEGLHAELLSMMEGDEIATKYLLEFIARIATGDQSSVTSDHDAEEAADGPGGKVIDFPTPKAGEEDEEPGKHE